MDFTNIKDKINQLISNFQELNLLDKNLGKGDDSNKTDNDNPENIEGRNDGMSENEKIYTQEDVDALVKAAVTNELAKLESGKEIENLKVEIASLTEKIKILETEKAEEMAKAEKSVKDFEDFKAGLEKAKIVEARLQEIKDKGLEIEDIESMKSFAERYTDEEWQKHMAILISVAEKAKKVPETPSPMETASEHQGTVPTENKNEGTSEDKYLVLNKLFK